MEGINKLTSNKHREYNKIRKIFNEQNILCRDGTRVGFPWLL